MNNLACSTASYLVNSAWEVSLIGGAGWAVSRLLKKLGPRVEHVAWVVTLALAVLTPALPLWRWLLNAVSTSTGANGHLSIALIAGEGGRSNAGNAALLSPTLILALLVLYAMAVLYFAARLCSSLYLTTRLLKDAEPLVFSPEKDSVWKRCQRMLAIKNALTLSSDQIAGPVTIAFRRPVLLLPPNFSKECSDHDFLAAVAHECAHIQRRDFQKNLLYEVASLAIAFHPVTWMVKSKIAQTREMICDGIATERLIDPHTYTQSLLRLATMVSTGPQTAPSHAIGIFDANILEKRVMMMSAKKQHFSLFVKYGLIVPAVLVLLSVAAGAGAMAVAIAPQTMSQAGDQDKPYGQVYKLGKDKDISPPELISSVAPEYPEAARKGKDKFDGKCLVNIVVDSSGVPHDVHIVRSLRPDFDASAIKAVEQYRFKPAKRAGEPVAVSVNVEVNFQKW
jgi:TonB family protein